MAVATPPKYGSPTANTQSSTGPQAGRSPTLHRHRQTYRGYTHVDTVRLGLSRFNWIKKVWTEVNALWRRSKLWILHVFALAWARVRWIRIGWTEFIGHWRRGKRWVLRILTFVWSRVRQFAWLLVLATVLVIVWLIFKYWDWLSNVGNDLWGWLGSTPSGQDREETNSSTLRNVGLLFAGFVALLIAGWRSWVAGRQAKTAEQDLLNDCYQKGAEMLGNDVLSVRLGGIYALHYNLESQLNPMGVRVHVVCPGSISTPLKLENIADIAKAEGKNPEEAVAKARQELGHPLGVARVLTFLASRDADYVRGTVFTR